MRQDGWKVKAFEWGSFALDGGAMFGVIPKRMWSKVIESDEHNRIPLALRSLYLEKGPYKVLIDVGMGNQWSEKLTEIYKLESSPVESVMAREVGVTPNDITHILITHLHFDHCGGLSTRFGDEWKSTFPNAEIIISLENLRNANSPNPREMPNYLGHFWADPAARGQITPINSEWMEIREVLPGLHMRRVDGHTRGQSIIYVDGSEKDSVFLADLCPTEHHLRNIWVMGIDLEAGLSVKEKTQIFSEAETLKRELIFQHDTQDKFRLCGKKFLDASYLEKASPSFFADV